MTRALIFYEDRFPISLHQFSYNSPFQLLEIFNGSTYVPDLTPSLLEYFMPHHRWISRPTRSRRLADNCSVYCFKSIGPPIQSSIALLFQTLPKE